MADGPDCGALDNGKHLQILILVNVYHYSRNSIEMLIVKVDALTETLWCSEM